MQSGQLQNLLGSGISSSIWRTRSGTNGYSRDCRCLFILLYLSLSLGSTIDRNCYKRSHSRRCLKQPLPLQTLSWTSLIGGEFLDVVAFLSCHFLYVFNLQFFYKSICSEDFTFMRWQQSSVFCVLSLCWI